MGLTLSQSIALAALVSAQQPSSSQYIGSSGAWSVYKLLHACSLETTLESGTGVGIAQGADIAISPKIFLRNSAWNSLKDGQRVPLDLSWTGTDGGVAVDRTGTGFATAVPGNSGLVLQFGLPYGALLEAFSSSRTIEVSTSGTSLASIPTRPVDAVLRLFTCAQGTADPFAKH